MSFFMSVSVLVPCPALHSVSDVMYMYVSMFHSLYMCTYLRFLRLKLCELMSFSSSDFKFSVIYIHVYIQNYIIIEGYRIFKQNHATRCIGYLLMSYHELSKISNKKYEVNDVLFFLYLWTSPRYDMSFCDIFIQYHY